MALVPLLNPCRLDTLCNFNSCPKLSHISKVYFHSFAVAVKVKQRGKHYIKECEVSVYLILESNGSDLGTAGDPEERLHGSPNNVSVYTSAYSMDGYSKYL